MNKYEMRLMLARTKARPGSVRWAVEGPQHSSTGLSAAKVLGQHHRNVGKMHLVHQAAARREG